MLRYAVLLDGGFVRRKLATATRPLAAEDVGSLVASIGKLPELAQMRLHRAYFYDAKPLESVEELPFGGGVLDFGTSAAAARNRGLQSALARQPFVALRFGELHCEGWRLKKKVLKKKGPSVEISAADFEPNIRQKGVDMRIGLDIANLTLKRHADVIVLVTADSDFVPAMKFARREGAQLLLVTLGHGVREGMREHADVVIDRFPLQ